MRIDEMGADEFMIALGEVAAAISAIKESKPGKKFASDFTAKAKRMNEKGGVDGIGSWAMGEILKRLPQFTKECGDDVYRLLAACDGITVDEYKAKFTPRKLISDVSALVEWASANEEEVGAFFG